MNPKKFVSNETQESEYKQQRTHIMSRGRASAELVFGLLFREFFVSSVALVCFGGELRPTVLFCSGEGA